MSLFQKISSFTNSSLKLVNLYTYTYKIGICDSDIQVNSIFFLFIIIPTRNSYTTNLDISLEAVRSLRTSISL